MNFNLYLLDRTCKYYYLFIYKIILFTYLYIYYCFNYIRISLYLSSYIRYFDNINLFLFLIYTFLNTDEDVADEYRDYIQDIKHLVIYVHTYKTFSSADLDLFENQILWDSNISSPQLINENDPIYVQNLNNSLIQSRTINKNMVR